MTPLRPWTHILIFSPFHYGPSANAWQKNERILRWHRLNFLFVGSIVNLRHTPEKDPTLLDQPPICCEAKPLKTLDTQRPELNFFHFTAKSQHASDAPVAGRGAKREHKSKNDNLHYETDSITPLQKNPFMFLIRTRAIHSRRMTQQTFHSSPKHRKGKHFPALRQPRKNNTNSATQNGLAK